MLGSLVVARLYVPAEFGLFASWLGGTSLLAVVITGRYELALALEPDGESRRVGAAAVLVSVLLATGTALMALCLIWIVGLPLLAHPELWCLGALAAALVAIGQIWQAWAAADGRYRHLASIRISQAAAITFMQIGGGLITPTVHVLALAHASGVACGLVVALWQCPLPLRQPEGTTWRRAIQAYCVRHRRQPMLSLPADSVNASASQLPLMIVTARFGAEVAGWLALTMRILGGPISLLGASVLDVFRRQAAQAWRERGECRGEYLNSLTVLAGAAAAFAVVLTLFSEPLFEMLFGVGWRRSGTIAVWLLPMFAMRFVASPLSYMFYIADKQHLDLLWQLTLLAMTLVALMLPTGYSAALGTYSLGYSMLYVIYLHLSYRFSLGRPPQ